MKKMLKSMINSVLSGETRIIFLFTLLLMVNTILIAQVPEWQWATQAGGSNGDVGFGIIIDNVGNSYVTGEFRETANFGTYSLTSCGLFDIFVAKIDADGNWQWATQAGGISGDSGRGIITDNAGNCYVTGFFHGTVTFGSYSLTSSGLRDIFVAKIDTDGNWLWATQSGGSDTDAGYSITIDNAGNTYITGFFEATATFGSYSLTSCGMEDIFAAKIDAAGNWLWATQAGGSGIDKGYSITIDDAGNSYVTGFFYEYSTFGSYSLTSSGGRDIFVAKMDSSGNWQWAIQAGGSNSDIGFGITIDNSGNTYVTGAFEATATFGSYSLTNSGERDIFVAKMDEDGNWLWATQAGGNSFDHGYFITIDDAGISYVTGQFRETATFGSYSITSWSSAEDIFVAKIDTDGNWLWATQAGGNIIDEGFSITINDAGNCYVTGLFYETTIFGSHTLTSSGSADIFVAKLFSGTNIGDDFNITPTLQYFSNYPNTYNPTTTISFSTPVVCNRDLSIYNIKGQFVKTLIDDYKYAGEHSIVWDGRDSNGNRVSSGIYFYKLKAGDFQKVRKMILLK